MINCVFVPIGSYEQHGPHLPLDTDYLIAKKIVKIVAPIFKAKIIEGLKIGISPEHIGLAKTRSTSQKDFIFKIENILTNFKKDVKFVFINAHGGNTDTLNLIQKFYKKKMLVLNTFSLIKKELNEIRTSKIGGICHAGEFETSLMLYLYPEKVKINILKKSDIKYVPFLDPNYKGEKIKNWKTINYNTSGIIGDPYHATLKKGEKWFKILIEKIKYFIKEFIN